MSSSSTSPAPFRNADKSSLDASLTVRQRARFLLGDACTNGRLEIALGRLDVFCEPAIGTNAAAGASSIGSRAKGRDRGRSIQSAMKLGVQQKLDPAADRSGSPGTAGTPDSRPNSRQHGTHAGAELHGISFGDGHKPSQQVLQKCQSCGTHFLGDADFCLKCGMVREAITVTSAFEVSVDPKKTKEEALKTKHAEAERQAAIKEKKEALHRQRLLFIEQKIKPILESLVAGVSQLSARPDNPVPLMIGMLAEMNGKPVNAVKHEDPDKRLKREIKQLQEEIEQLQELKENPYEEVSDDEEEDKSPQEEDMFPQETEAS